MVKIPDSEARMMAPTVTGMPVMMLTSSCQPGRCNASAVIVNDWSSLSFIQFNMKAALTCFVEYLKHGAGSDGLEPTGIRVRGISDLAKFSGPGGVTG